MVDIQHNTTRTRIGALALGQAIRSRRVDASVTQSELADRLRVHRATVCRLEAGKGNPTWAVVNRIAGALDTPVEDLVVLARMFEAVR